MADDRGAEITSGVSHERPPSKRLIPWPPSDQLPEITKARAEGKTPGEISQIRERELRKVPDFDTEMRKYIQEQGKEPEPNKNYGLMGVEDFQRDAKDLQALRKAVKYAKNPEERRAAMAMFEQKKESLYSYFQPRFAIPFEKAYREYIHSKVEFIHFKTAQSEVVRLTSLLREPQFMSIPDDAPVSFENQARLQRVSRSATDIERTLPEDDIIRSSLLMMYEEDSPEFKQALAELTVGQSEQPEGTFKTKAEISDELKKQQAEIKRLWSKSRVRRFWATEEMHSIVRAFARGDDVIETQSTIAFLNRLNDIELSHGGRGTIGAYVVGPPGVGKTTGIRHYLELKGRTYGYMDLSEEVTRYLLFGQKTLEFKSSVDQYEQVIGELAGMDNDRFARFLQGNKKNLMETFGLSQDEATITLFGQLDEVVQKAGEQKTTLTDEEKAVRDTQLTTVKERIQTIAKEAQDRELAHNLIALVKKNGWRDGVLIANLRRGNSMILDEANKMRNFSLLHGLATAKPGSMWYFADNNEYLYIPLDWRMYLTANIGKKHGVFTVPETVASRSEGRVIEVDYPPPSEEMKVALASLADPDDEFLRLHEPKEGEVKLTGTSSDKQQVDQMKGEAYADIIKLYITIYELFPKVREYIESQSQIVPISYRTIRNLGEELVTYFDIKTGRPVFVPTDKTFDQALWSVLIDTYKLYESQEIPHHIVELATTMGLLLDDSVKDKVIGVIGEEDYQKKKDAFEKPENKKDLNEVLKRMQALKSADMGTIPVAKTV